MGLPWWKLIVQGGGDFVFVRGYAMFTLPTITWRQSRVLWEFELWSVNCDVWTWLPLLQVTVHRTTIFRQDFSSFCEICKKRCKMKYRREWEPLPFCNSEPTLSSTFGHTFTTWFDFSSVSREFSKDLKSHFRTLAADAFKRGKTHASTSLFTNYFPCLDWSRKWCDVLFNQSGTNPKITTDIWLGSRLLFSPLNYRTNFFYF